MEHFEIVAEVPYDDGTPTDRYFLMPMKATGDHLITGEPELVDDHSRDAFGPASMAECIAEQARW